MINILDMVVADAIMCLLPSLICLSSPKEGLNVQIQCFFQLDGKSEIISGPLTDPWHQLQGDAIASKSTSYTFCFDILVRNTSMYIASLPQTSVTLKVTSMAL